jgi:Na+-driven multidrug efflux pump
MLPSLIGELFKTSGSLVDGMLIGNHLGVTALALVSIGVKRIFWRPLRSQV